MKRGARLALGAGRVAIAAALLVYLARSGVLDWSALGRLTAAWSLTLAALGVLMVDVVITAWRLCVVLRPRGLHLSLGGSVRLALIGVFFSHYLPGGAGGDAARIYYGILGNEGRRTEVATVMMLDRAIGMLGMLLLPLLLAPALSRVLGESPALRLLLYSAAALSAAMLACVLVAWSDRVRGSELVARLLPRLPLGRHIGWMLETVHSYRRHGGTLAAAVGISLVAHALSVVVVLLLVEAITPGAAAWGMSVLIPLGFLANTLPITPGGLGVGEAAADGLFRLAGFEGGAQAMLAWRLLIFGLGLLGLVAYLRGGRRLIHQGTPETPEPRAAAGAAGAVGGVPVSVS